MIQIYSSHWRSTAECERGEAAAEQTVVSDLAGRWQPLLSQVTAAVQQLLGGSSPGASRPPPDRVSVASAISNSAAPAKGCRLASPLARDVARPKTLGYPRGVEGGTHGTFMAARRLGRGAGAAGAEGSPTASSSSPKAAPPPLDLRAARRTLFSPETRASLVT